MNRNTRKHHRGHLFGMVEVLRAMHDSHELDCRFHDPHPAIIESRLQDRGPLLATLTGVADVLELLVVEDRIWRRGHVPPELGHRLAAALRRAADEAEGKRTPPT